jgi:hypothetical protein
MTAVLFVLPSPLVRMRSLPQAASGLLPSEPDFEKESSPAH